MDQTITIPPKPTMKRFPRKPRGTLTAEDKELRRKAFYAYLEAKRAWKRAINRAEVAKFEALQRDAIFENVLSALASAAPRGLNVSDLTTATGLTRKQVRSALSRMEEQERVFRFDVDGEERVAPGEENNSEFFCLYEDRARAWVLQPFKLSEGVERLYAGFGIHAPPEIARTPKFKPLGDEGHEEFSRYKDGA